MVTETDVEDEYEDLDPSILLCDGTCWIADPYYLDEGEEFDGALAVQYKDGTLWWLSGKTRKWIDVTQSNKTVLRTVK